MLDQVKALLNTSDDSDGGAVVTTRQAAAMLKVTEQRIRQLVESGTLAAVKERRSEFDRYGRWAIRVKDVWEYDRARQRRAVFLRKWRMAWARRQNDKRRRIAELRKLAEGRKRYESQD